MTAAALSAQTALREVAPEGFLIGGIFDAGQYNFDVPESRSLAAREFNIMTVSTKRKILQKNGDFSKYAFTSLDTTVAFCIRNGITVHGHTLVYPKFETTGFPRLAELDSAALENVMYSYIDTIMHRYKGKIAIYDVVNEPLARHPETNQWELRVTDNVFYDKLGHDSIEKAYRRAHRADPDALLILNENNNEVLGKSKADAFYKLAKDLVGKGVPLHGVGFQCHYRWKAIDTWGFPDTAAMLENFQRFADLGLKVFITEMDVDMQMFALPPTDSLFAEQGKLYAAVMRTLLRCPTAAGFQTWGISDNYSWLNFPQYDYGPGDPHPLMFDTRYQPKPAADSVRAVLANASGTHSTSVRPVAQARLKPVHTAQSFVLFSLMGRRIHKATPLEKADLSSNLYVGTSGNHEMKRIISIQPR
jgi:endo-1,4-beta-xylanase